jgi:hypothetical protein
VSCLGRRIAGDEKPLAILGGYERRSSPFYRRSPDLRDDRPDLFGLARQKRESAQVFLLSGNCLAASRLKVNLPGITGTMSVNFLFLLLGVLELSLPETMAWAARQSSCSVLTASRPNPIQVAFNVCSTRSPLR